MNKTINKPEKIDYITYKYPIRDEITGEIIGHREISGKEFKKLTKYQQQKLKKISETLFDKEKYEQDLKNYNNKINKFTVDDVKDVVQMITDIYKDLGIDSTGYYIDKDFLNNIDHELRNELEYILKDSLENYLGKIIFITAEYNELEEVIDIDPDNPVKTLRNIIAEFKHNC